MRIRSIKPEFWRSEDVSSLEIQDRLLFIGLWSYVDDNGVGVDRGALIAADLFADDLSREPRETLARVSGGLQKLFSTGLIHRYEHDGKHFLHINQWKKHQRVDKPRAARYPTPDELLTSTVTESDHDSRSPRENYGNPPEVLAPGTGEQGNRGTGEQTDARSARPVADAPSTDPRRPASSDRTPRPDPAEGFEDFWDIYPRKVGKPKAREAFIKAKKRAKDADAIITGLKAQIPGWAQSEAKYIPHPTTWLNRDGWEDTPAVAATEPRSPWDSVPLIRASQAY